MADAACPGNTGSSLFVSDFTFLSISGTSSGKLVNGMLKFCRRVKGLPSDGAVLLLYTSSKFL